MKKETAIEWASHTWNPYTWKCNKVSQGCKNCYMMAQASRYGQDPNGTPQWREAALKELPRIPSGSVVFVNSMSDTYHEGVSLETIQRVHDVIASYPDITFLLLTKRIERARELALELTWSPNIWIGTSVENRSVLHRLNDLIHIPAGGHFVSVEPQLEEINLLGYLHRGVDWVICGGESGAGRRYFDKNWARALRDECQQASVPFLFKQGAAFKSGQDRLLDGRTWDETPFQTIQADVKQVPTQMTLF